MTPTMSQRVTWGYCLVPFLLLTLYSCHRAPPLHHYARGGSVVHMQAVLSQGADVNGVDESGNTALIYAARGLMSTSKPKTVRLH